MPDIKRIKAACPDLTIVVGGYFPTNHVNTCSKDPMIDYVVLSAGEDTLLELLDTLDAGGDPAMVAHKFEVLRQHCERAGRPFDAVTRSNDVGILIAANERELQAKKARYGEKFDLVGTPDQILDRGTDFRFLQELRRELKEA